MHTPATPLLAAVLLPAGALLGLVTAVGWAGGIDPGLLTRDPASIAGVPPLAGVLSNLGVLGWWTSASVWWFVAMLNEAGLAPDELRFARASAALSAWLALDDLFQIHEALAPTWLGLSERLVFVLLGLAVLAYALRHRERLAHGEGAPLPALAFVWLAASLVFDQLPARWVAPLGAWEYVVEDGAKWLGIACWCGYSLAAARALLQQPRGRPQVLHGRDAAPHDQRLISGS